MKYPRQIYVITHNVTKRKYVGSSAKVDERILNHMYVLRAGKHHVEEMQKDFNEFGENYTVEIVGEINSIHENGKEYEWMTRLQTYERETGYNYKDRTAPHNKKKRVPSNRSELHKIVDTLTENQCLFILTFLKRILGHPLEQANVTH